MSQIPSDIATSAAQAGFQAREATKVREAHQAGQAHSANRQVRAADEAGSTVDTTDADERVFTDAEGSGSQGRFTEDKDASELTENPAGSADSPHGITRGPDGLPHVDLEA